MAYKDPEHKRLYQRRWRANRPGYGMMRYHELAAMKRLEQGILSDATWSMKYPLYHEARTINSKINKAMSDRLRCPPKSPARQKRQGVTVGYNTASNVGLTIDQYTSLLSHHNGRCDICGGNKDTGKKRLSLDHCHTTGTIRGFLCLRCNTGLGMFRDNQSFLRAAAAYLEMYTY